MSIKQSKIISKLLICAESSTLKNKHAAAICVGGKIIAMGHNSQRTKIGQEIHCSLHSEIACLYKMHAIILITQKMRRKMKKTTLYSVKHSMNISLPCDHCFKKIKRAGIKKIIYVDSNGAINKIKTSDLISTYITRGYRDYYQQNIKID